jgi:hypothetical protein
VPIRYELNYLRRRVAVTIDGPFTPADFRTLIERRRADNTGAYGILYDLRGMTGEPTTADLQYGGDQSRITTDADDALNGERRHPVTEEPGYV